MGIEALDDSLDNDYEDDVVAVVKTGGTCLDARRRLEDKMEELRLRREMREFDFDE